jgi:cytochrome d ubiquinol oxidase subunit I
MDVLIAARAQMAVSLIFHIVFAAIGIGLPLLMVIAERRWIATGQPHYLALTKKWAKATGLLFAIGAISGTALSFEIGLLWPKYMEILGGTVGHLFALEGFAFFIEAIFIGLYLYGWNRLSATAHWLCGIVVAVSGALSGVLVLGVNSWMQQPVGLVIENGRIVSADPLAVFTQYGWFTMGLHSTLSCYIAVGFAVAGVYAWGWLKGKRDAYHASALKIAMAVGAITAILQPVSGDLLAKFVFHTQPAKFASMEGQFKTETHAPLRLGGWPDVEAGETRYALEVPGGLSFMATGDPAANVPGLNDIPRENWPNVHVTHLAFQVMVGLGMALMALGAWFWISWWRKKEGALESRWLVRTLVVAASFGFIALEAGWIVTEVGRQPWVIQPNAANGFSGLRTADAVTPASGVPFLFFGFTLLYLVLAAITVLLLRGLSGGGHEVQAPQGPVPAVT